MTPWRLGLDIGTNSIGWAIVDLDASDLTPCGLREMGVRIFSDGREPAKPETKTGLPRIGESLAVARRIARGMRRNRDRRLKRFRAVADRLVEFGLAPSGKSLGSGKLHTALLDKSIDPYEARAKAASEIVTKEELARALFHLCKRRGFLSNRRTDGEDKDASERKAAIQGFQKILDGQGLTLGQYLHGRIREGLHVRFRGYEFADAEKTIAIYPSRAMYEDEFGAIRKVQGNALLADEQWDELFGILSFQRPLLPIEPGVCTFEHGEDGRERHPRASRHLPIAHSFRIVQEINNLRYLKGGRDYPLSQEQRQILYDALETQKSLAFSKIRTSLLKLGRDASFNLESARRKGLDGNKTACEMRTLFQKHSQDWDALDGKTQNDIVQTTLDAPDVKHLGHANRESGWGLPSGLIDGLAAKYFPSSHGHISRRCMEKLLPLMREGRQYWDAAREIYGDHTDYSRFATGEILETLPYYGEVLRGVTAPVRTTPLTPDEEARYGRIANPTVHVALNQLRKLVNALVTRHGHPHEIHLELARNLKTSGKRYQELLKRMGENTVKNENRRKMFAESPQEREPSGLDMAKMRLWEELAQDDTDGGSPTMARVDVYTGKTIGFTQLFSDEIEIEHILPFGRTYDNSMANKTVTFRDVNRRKGGRMLPYEFARTDPALDAEAMASRAGRLPKNKRWRFMPDAAETYERMLTKNMTAEERRAYDADKDGAFIDRQLVDTQYISRMAARYLVPLVGEPSRVVPVNGHVTNLLRNKWDINAIKDKGGDKERQDHRHHAEDALLVALADRKLIKRIADETRREQENRIDFRAKLSFPERPTWATDKRIREEAERINVSFRENHAREAKLHLETAYGLLDPDDPWCKRGYNGVVRRPITALKENEIDLIRDDAVRSAVKGFLRRPDIQAVTKWEDKLTRLAAAGLRIGGAKETTRIRRVRIVVKNQSITPVESAPYKGYATDSIAFCDIWRAPKINKNGKATGKWGFVGAFVSYADAKKYEGDEDGLHERTKPHPAAKKIMRLFKNDMIALTDAQGRKRLFRVAGYSATDNRLDIRPHTESGGKKTYKAIPVLMEQDMRKIRISVDGRPLGQPRP